MALRDVAAAGGRGKDGIAPVVVMALRCNAGLRMLSGFLTIYMAFLASRSCWPDGE